MLVQIGSRSTKVSDALGRKVRRLTNRQQNVFERQLRHIQGTDMVRIDPLLQTYGPDLKAQVAVQAALFGYPLGRETIDITVRSLEPRIMGTLQGFEPGKYEIEVSSLVASPLPFASPFLWRLMRLDRSQGLWSRSDLENSLRLHGLGETFEAIDGLGDLFQLIKYRFSAPRIIGNSAELVSYVCGIEATHAMHFMWLNKFGLPHPTQMIRVATDTKFPKLLNYLRSMGFRTVPFPAWASLFSLSEDLDQIQGVQDTNDRTFILQWFLKMFNNIGAHPRFSRDLMAPKNDEALAYNAEQPSISYGKDDFYLPGNPGASFYHVAVDKVALWTKLGYIKPSRISRLLDYFSYYFCFSYPVREDLSDLFGGDIAKLLQWRYAFYLNASVHLMTFWDELPGAPDTSYFQETMSYMYKHFLGNGASVVFADFPEFIDFQPAGMPIKRLAEQARAIYGRTNERYEAMFPHDVYNSQLASKSLFEYLIEVKLSQFVMDLKALIQKRIAEMENMPAPDKNAIASLRAIHDEISLEAVAAKKYLKMQRSKGK